MDLCFLGESGAPVKCPAELEGLVSGLLWSTCVAPSLCPCFGSGLNGDAQGYRPILASLLLAGVTGFGWSEPFKKREMMQSPHEAESHAFLWDNYNTFQGFGRFGRIPKFMWELRSTSNIIDWIQYLSIFFI